MTSPNRRTPITTPKYHRTVFGNQSPNLVSQSTISIFNGNNILSPNFNVVNSDWSNYSNSISGSTQANLQKKSNRSPNKLHRKTSTSGLNFKNHKLSNFFTEKFNSNNSNENKEDTTFTTKSNSGSPRKLRRTNTNELLDRFIPSRQTTSGKLSIEKTKSLPSFALPYEHIESQTSKIYQNTVAEACGLEVGQRILQFQPLPPENKSNLKRMNSLNVNAMNNKFKIRPIISTNAAQSRMKRIPTCPEKVLDAPGLIDDFYLNLLSWSNENILAIALSNSVYCWNATSGTVDLVAECDCLVTSIKWSPDGFYLSIGLDNGTIEIWDIETSMKLRTMQGSDSRIGSHCWNDHLLTSGSRNGNIVNHDVRISNHVVMNLNNHSAEVCGLEWRSDGLQLASGGNDNIVNIWDCRSSIPQFTKTAHTAAVKALSWCPTQTNLLATGGGSACKKIHFWNTTTGSRVNTIETGSQVSSLQWGYANGIGKEIASTHGFPNNEISVHSYPSLQKTGVIMDSHESRVLNSCLSPDGTTLATVAADENLKFWKLFDLVPEIKSNDELSAGSGKDMGKIMTIR